jgi:hypothetical protein
MRVARVVHVRPASGGRWIIVAEFTEPLSLGQVQEIDSAAGSDSQTVNS